MKINVSMELTKNEIVNSINGICEKYNVPLSLLNIILTNINIEVNNMAQQELQKDLAEYYESQKEEKESEE